MGISGVLGDGIEEGSLGNPILPDNAVSRLQ
jgi:hypothetical protein